MTLKGTRTPGHTFPLHTAWQKFKEVEEWCYSPGQPITSYLAAWDNKVLAAVEAGCDFSDPILAFILLSKFKVKRVEVERTMQRIEAEYRADGSCLLDQVKLYIKNRFVKSRDHGIPKSPAGVSSTVTDSNKKKYKKTTSSPSILPYIKKEYVDPPADPFSDSPAIPTIKSEFPPNPTRGVTKLPGLNKLAMTTKKSSKKGRKKKLMRTGGHKRFECDYCGKQFMYRAKLVVHVRLHTGELPFSCPMCEERFSRNDHVMRHAVTHHGCSATDCLFPCGRCSERFRTSRQLEVHCEAEDHWVGEPTGKHHTCPHCPERFVTKSRLRQHVGYVHPQPRKRKGEEREIYRY